jgi:hypothetical protein
MKVFLLCVAIVVVSLFAHALSSMMGQVERANDAANGVLARYVR